MAPFPGLRAFRRDESHLFFGRERCVDAMLQTLARRKMLAVLGSSGSGKSSLVRTGLIDALKAGFHPDGSHWRVADFTPGAKPMANLACALLEARRGTSDRAPTTAETQELAGLLTEGPRSAVQWWRSQFPGDGPQMNLLLLADQFEELFRYGSYSQREEAEEFVSLLLESAQPGSPIQVAITMRSEYLGACSLITGLAERISESLYLTPRMTRNECRDAIEGPARVMGVAIEPALVSTVLNDMAAFAPWETGDSADQLERLSRQADQLPLMQHVMNRLWVTETSSAGENPVLRLAQYRALGGLKGAINAQGREILDQLPAEVASLAQPVFRALVSGSTIASAVRRPCRFDELQAVAGCDAEPLQQLLDAFSSQSCNFLRTSGSGASAIVDISHESLIRQWALLEEWFRKEAADAAEWLRAVDDARRHPDGLTGHSLQTLLEWWESSRPTAAWAARYSGSFEEVLGFVERSRQAEMRRTKEGAEKVAQVLEEINSILQSDRYLNLFGAESLQAEILNVIERNQVQIEASFSGVVDPATRVRLEDRLAMAFEAAGRAKLAAEQTEKAFIYGRDALRSANLDDPRIRSLLGTTMLAGYTYSWHLFDAGDFENGDAVAAQLRQWLPQGDVADAPEELLEGMAGVYNLLARIADDLDNAEEAAFSMRTALALQKRAVQIKPGEVRLLSALKTYYENVSREEFKVEIHATAEAMIRTNPGDRRAIRAYIKLRLDLAAAATSPEAKRRFLVEAEDHIQSLLFLAPGDQEMLFRLAEIEVALAETYRQDEAHKEQLEEYAQDAKTHFLLALKDRPMRQSNTRQIRSLYEGLSELPSEKGSGLALAQWHLEIEQALQGTLAAFPNSPEMNYVTAQTSIAAAQALAEDSTQQDLRRRALRTAVDRLPKSVEMRRARNFSEIVRPFAESCQELVKDRIAAGDFAEAIEVEKCLDACAVPHLERFPWDFYVRMQHRDTKTALGIALSESGRAGEALPLLHFASHWGERKATEALAALATEESAAGALKTLAAKQELKRFTIPCDFGGQKAPFHFYTLEWPAEYPYTGVDDQAEWLLKARGGQVDPKVTDSFRKLHAIARENDVSFASLCEYALSEQEPKTEPESAPEPAAKPKTQVEQSRGSLASTPHPKADPDGAMRRNAEYREALTKWEKLSAWQKLRTKKPEPPPGVLG